jgi:hypothetical protein
MPPLCNPFVLKGLTSGNVALARICAVPSARLRHLLFEGDRILATFC